MPHLLTRQAWLALVLAASPGSVTADAPALAPSSTTVVTPSPARHEVPFAGWSLTPAERQRLADVLPTERAFTDSEHLTPFEILGKHARTDGERQRYAKRYLAAAIEDQRRALAWASALATELDRLADEPSPFLTREVVSTLTARGYKGQVAGRDDTLSRSPSHAGPISDTPSRLQAFVTLDTCLPCDRRFAHALEAVRDGRYTGIDVVFVGMTRPDRVTATRWAGDRGITIDEVATRAVTLNAETPAWLSVRAGRRAPVILVAATGRVFDAP